MMSSAEGGAAVLLVDDRQANLVALKAVLEPLGAPLLLAQSGEEALRHLMHSDVCCVLLDVQMPGIDGFETARLIKERQRTRYIPIIFLTAVSREEANIVRGYSAGAVDYVVKPYDPDILRAKVRVFVELATHEQSLRDDDARMHRERLSLAIDAERLQLRDLFSNAPVAICILEGPRHTFTFANPSYLMLVNGRDILGKPLLEALPELRGAGFDRLMDQVVATGEPYIGREVAVKLAHHGPDEVDYMNFVYQPKLAADGSVTGVLCCAFEVTDQVVARMKAEALAAELGEAVKSRDTFLSVASHELRTPLTSLALRLQQVSAAMREHADDEKWRSAERALQAAQQQTRRLGALVDSLLDVSRLAAGKLELSFEQVDLATIVDEVVARFEHDAKRAGSELVSKSVPVVGSWDRLRIEQVLTNLLSNAIKYGAGRQIRVTLERSEDGVRLVVSDHGIGLDPESLSRIFQKFERAVSDRHFGGLGLGLYVSKQIVDALGGTIRAANRQGSGAEFIVTLPIRH